MRELSHKLRSLEQAAEDAAAEKAAGRTVVLANGIFDLLHVGHVRYLQGARREGDFLIVAVNGDAGTRQLKGEGRPYQPSEERAELVAAFNRLKRAWDGKPMEAYRKAKSAFIEAALAG